MKAKEYLGSIEMLDTLIESKMVEAHQLRALATSVSAPIGRDGSGGTLPSDRIGNVVSRLVDLQAEIDVLVDGFIDRRADCIKAIEVVSKPIYYTLLHKHYVQFKTLAEIAEEEHYSIPHMSELHREALAEVQEYLDKRR